jgi:hypothetical protein
MRVPVGAALLGRPLRFYILPITAFLLVVVTFFSYRDVYSYVKASPTTCWVQNKAHKGEVDIFTTVQREFASKIHDLENDKFVNDKGNLYEIVPDVKYRWPQLKEKIMIMDIDTRLDVGQGGMMNEKAGSESTMLARTGGYLNHMLYAMIHGYEYRLVRPPVYEEPERSGAWTKLPAIREALKSHEIVMFLDADAIFENLELPLEWMLSHWNITKKTMVALPEDVHQTPNYDDQGQLFWNAGVIVAQSGERKDDVQELFNRWEDCPTEKEYKGCAKWLVRWAAEQAAFNNYIRYTYDQQEDLRVLPCNEANGNYGHKSFGCHGNLVSHWWHQKEFVVTRLFQQADTCTVYNLHQHFLKEQSKYFVDWSDLKYPLKDVSL